MPKLCPFNVHIEQVNQNRYVYNEDNQQTFHEHKLVEVQRPTPCAGKKCAAYRFGRCTRKS
jgi:hypothetical protein